MEHASIIGEEGEILNGEEGGGEELVKSIPCRHNRPYLIFVIFFTQAKFLENKIYTEIHTILLCITVYYTVNTIPCSDLVWFG